MVSVVLGVLAFLVDMGAFFRETGVFTRCFAKRPVNMPI